MLHLILEEFRLLVLRGGYFRVAKLFVYKIIGKSLICLIFFCENTTVESEDLKMDGDQNI